MSTLIYLAGVAATSSTSAWAVGGYNPHTAYRTLIEHWNGKAWEVSTSPNRRRFSSNFLDAVATPSSTNILAVGSSQGPDRVGPPQNTTLALHCG